MRSDEIALASPEERRILFSDASIRMPQNIPEAMVEKDFWVCYVLEHIFSRADGSGGADRGNDHR